MNKYLKLFSSVMKKQSNDEGALRTAMVSVDVMTKKYVKGNSNIPMDEGMLLQEYAAFLFDQFIYGNGNDKMVEIAAERWPGLIDFSEEVPRAVSLAAKFIDEEYKRSQTLALKSLPENELKWVNNFVKYICGLNTRCCIDIPSEDGCVHISIEKNATEEQLVELTRNMAYVCFTRSSFCLRRLDGDIWKSSLFTCTDTGMKPAKFEDDPSFFGTLNAMESIAQHVEQLMDGSISEMQLNEYIKKNKKNLVTEKIYIPGICDSPVFEED